MLQTEFRAGPVTMTALDNQGSGEVVIGLHGFLDNAASMEGLAPYVHNYRYIALDLAGHGGATHRPHGTHYNLLDYIQDLHAFIQEQAFDSVILMGHSLGGILASLYAAVFPESVRGVISIDACGPLTEPESTSAAQIRESVESRWRKTRNRLRVVDLEKAIAARCEVSDISAEHARMILRRNLTQDAGGHYFWASDPKLRTKSSLRLTEGQAQALMENIRCPVLFIAASDSFKTVDKVFSQRQDWFVNASCLQFAGGHHIHMEKPDEVGAAIRHFVEQL
ncbi:alpha/beta fold hydrolase [Salinimonas chungwhensis]|uniref:alpha/beta fold hydrolase n=1 Tax=Salinimonas chungwhensis TaxID=265425 RepID=UPI000364E5C9|nr:alpha/beta hydrolase [Salinimonas chungwhensis]